MKYKKKTYFSILHVYFYSQSEPYSWKHRISTLFKKEDNYGQTHFACPIYLHKERKKPKHLALQKIVPCY